jgi:hypothetical protein
VQEISPVALELRGSSFELGVSTLSQAQPAPAPAARNDGGSAGVPSASSSLNRKPTIHSVLLTRLGPNGAVQLIGFRLVSLRRWDARFRQRSTGVKSRNGMEKEAQSGSAGRAAVASRKGPPRRDETQVGDSIPIVAAGSMGSGRPARPAAGARAQVRPRLGIVISPRNDRDGCSILVPNLGTRCAACKCTEQKNPPSRAGFQSGRPDLNRGPLVPQTSALTRLRHAPQR